MQQYSFLKIGFPERSNVVNWLSLHHNVSNTELCDTSNVVSKFSPHDSQFNDRLWDTSNEESEFLSHEIHVRALQRDTSSRLNLFMGQSNSFKFGTAPRFRRSNSFLLQFKYIKSRFRLTSKVFSQQPEHSNVSSLVFLLTSRVSKRFFLTKPFPHISFFSSKLCDTSKLDRLFSVHTNSFNRGLPVTSNAFNERLNAQCKTVSFGFRSVSNATSSFNMHRNSISTELWLTSKDLRQFPEQSNFTKRGFCVKSNVDIIFIQQFNSSNSGKYSIPAKEAIPRLEQSIFVAARPAGVTTTRLPFRRSLRYTPVPKDKPGNWDRESCIADTPGEQSYPPHGISDLFSILRGICHRIES